MKITLCGAAGEVTGSAYLVETRNARVLIDLGMFQGRGATFAKNSRIAPINARRLDAVVLTHAHLDHTGRLPLLARGKYRGAIHATAATIDFTRLLLLDAGALQEADARRESRRRQRQGQPPVGPLFTVDEVEALSPRFHALPYEEVREIADGVSIRLVDAGHMLGSASVEFTLREGSTERKVVFSGDLGAKGTPYLRDPTPLSGADLVFLESTYGDRDHRPVASTLVEFADILNESHREQGRVLIPAFAIGRSQQVLYYIAEFARAGTIPQMPLYLDSPMAIEATRLYEKHQGLFDDEAGALARAQQWRKDLSMLEFCETADASRRLNELSGAAVIIAGSGMCEGGRIVHHLKHGLWNPRNHVLFVGYQAEGTLGARLLDRARDVRIMGERVVVNAKLHSLGGFSGHAGQSELVEWAAPLAANRARFVLTHGESAAREALGAKLRERLGIDAECPGPLAQIELA